MCEGRLYVTLHCKISTFFAAIPLNKTQEKSQQLSVLHVPILSFLFYCSTAM